MLKPELLERLLTELGTELRDEMLRDETTTDSLLVSAWATTSFTASHTLNGTSNERWSSATLEIKQSSAAVNQRRSEEDQAQAQAPEFSYYSSVQLTENLGQPDQVSDNDSLLLERTRGAASPDNRGDDYVLYATEERLNAQPVKTTTPISGSILTPSRFWQRLQDTKLDGDISNQAQMYQKRVFEPGTKQVVNFTSEVKVGLAFTWIYTGWAMPSSSEIPYGNTKLGVWLNMLNGIPGNLGSGAVAVSYRNSEVVGPRLTATLQTEQNNQTKVEFEFEPSLEVQGKKISRIHADGSQINFYFDDDDNPIGFWVEDEALKGPEVLKDVLSNMITEKNLGQAA